MLVLQCDKSTALHFACTQGATPAVKVMLRSYDRVLDIVNITDGANQTPLHKYIHRALNAAPRFHGDKDYKGLWCSQGHDLRSL